jgi:hypothetical protein
MLLDDNEDDDDEDSDEDREEDNESLFCVADLLVLNDFESFSKSVFFRILFGVLPFLVVDLQSFKSLDEVVVPVSIEVEVESYLRFLVELRAGFSILRYFGL